MKLVATIFALFLLLAAQAQAAGPYLVDDPLAQCQTYVISDQSPLPQGATSVGSSPLSIPAQADGSLHWDLSTLAPATYAITVVACYGAWGCSTPVPFTLAKPSVSKVPTYRLSTQ